MVAVRETRNRHDHHAAVATLNGHSMAQSEIHNILQMVAWGTRLSLALYDFSACVPSATTEVIKLAKEVNLFSLVLRQVGASLKEDGGFPSWDAARTVKEILHQSRMVFLEIEGIVPVRGIRDERGRLVADGGMFPGSNWGWNNNSRLKAGYLLGHLESLKLTLNVLLQCLYVAKITTWSRRQRTKIAFDAVDTERLQMQSLIIEQQMALIRVYRLYQEYSLSKAAFPEPLQNANRALIQYDDREANPMALVPYQERTLSETEPAPTETEDLIRVRKIAPPFVDMLLHQWTRLDEIEQRMIEDGNSRRRDRKSNPGRWEQPTVESDSEDDFVYPRNGSSDRPLNGPGPVLMPVDEDIDLERGLPTSPIGIPGSPSINVHRASVSQNPQSPRSFNSSSFSPTQSNPYFSSSPTSAPPRAHRSPGPSPLSSPRGSFCSDGLPTPRQEQPDQPAIPWTLRLKSAAWSFHGPAIVDSNTPNSHVPALSDRSTTTELMATHISKQALEERNYDFQTVNKDAASRNGSKRTKFEVWYIVLRPLAWPDVLELVKRSEVLRRREKEWDERRARRGQDPLYVQPPPHPPPLDRSVSSPAGVGLSPGSARAAGKYPSPRSSGDLTTSDDSYEERRGGSSRRSSSQAKGSRSRRGSKGSGMMGAVPKVMAGAGLAALLGDLAEGLSAL